ncbi:MAG: universal stress protein [Verrucomicrobia bacterium]|nr:universal stress protein [Verrucomicrobiota bacterium]
MRIMCYTDLTERAHGAATVATELAARNDDTVLLIHPGNRAEIELRATAGTASKTVGADGNGRLREEIEYISTQGVPVKTAPLADAPARAVGEVALPARTRLVVVAASADSKSHGWRHASLAETIAENSLVPTLVVREPHSLLDWIRSGRVLRVLCAYDLSAPADAALTYLTNLLRLGPCNVIVTHVGQLSDEMARLGFRSPMCFEGSEPQVQRICEQDLREKVDAILGADAGVRIQYKGSWGRPDFDLVDLAKHENADLVVTGTHQWHGLDRLATCPYHASSCGMRR